MYKFSKTNVLKSKHAFSLAEILIVVGVIGVVMAVTMPTVIANMTERINSERHANIAQKVTKAMEQMKAHGLLNMPYASTDAFVDELQKYLKIAKRCDSDHIADCWPTAKVMTADGKELEVSKVKTGRNLSLGSYSKNVGLVLADGAALILNYNTKTDGIDIGDEVKGDAKELPVGGGKKKKFPYTSNVTAGIDFVTDVNGAKKPNKEKTDGKEYDIRSFGSASFTEGCKGVDIEGVGCVVDIGSSNLWGGGPAREKCVNRAGAGMTVPDIATLRAIYNKKDEYPDLPKNGVFWSNSPTGAYFPYTLNFANGEESTEYAYSSLRVLCVKP